MDTGYQWIEIYQKFIENVNESIFNWWHGICLAVFFFTFAAIIISLVQNKLLAESAPEQDGETGKKQQTPFAVSLKLVGFYYSLAFLFLTATCILRIANPQTNLLYMLPLILVIYLGRTKSRRFDTVRYSYRLNGCLFLIIFPLFFFTFVGVQGGLAALAFSKVNSMYHNPTIIEGTLLNIRKGSHCSGYLDLNISESRILTGNGLGEHVDMTGECSLECDYSDIPGDLKIGDTVVLLESYDSIYGYIDIRHKDQNSPSAPPHH